MRGKNKMMRADVIVIVCCVVLALLTVGMIGRTTRGLALELTCVSNVEVLTDAWLTYADEHDGALVGGIGWAGNPRTSPAVPTLEKKLETIRKGLLFPYVGDLNVYHCPADQRLNDPNRLAFGSFSIAGGANGQDEPEAYGYNPAKKYAEIPDPSAKYVFVEEADPRGYNVGAWQMFFNPLKWSDPLAMWHEESTTLGFADGRVEIHRWHDRSLIDWCHKAMYEPEAFTFGMTPSPQEGEDIEYMGDRFPCKSLR